MGKTGLKVVFGTKTQIMKNTVHYHYFAISPHPNTTFFHFKIAMLELFLDKGLKIFGIKLRLRTVKGLNLNDDGDDDHNDDYMIMVMIMIMMIMMIMVFMIMLMTKYLKK